MTKLAVNQKMSYLIKGPEAPQPIVETERENFSENSSLNSLVFSHPRIPINNTNDMLLKKDPPCSNNLSRFLLSDDDVSKNFNKIIMQLD